MSERKKHNKNHPEEPKNAVKAGVKEEKGKGAEEKAAGENEQGLVAVESPEESSVEKLQKQLDEKTKEAAEVHDQWLRLRAEFENFKKRMQKEKEDHLRYANETLLKALLPTVDDLERALNHGKNVGENDPLLKGVEITYRQLLNTLERFGVKPILPVGEIFDPEKHEAVMLQQSDQEPNRVLSETQKGYFFDARLLRPAKVIVAKPEEKTS